MRSLIGLILVGSGVAISGCGPRSADRSASRTQEAWNQANDPAILDVRTARWDQLAASGQSASQLWSGYWWPTRRGGIAYRWQTPVASDTYTAYEYQIPTAAAVAQLSQAQLNALSPAEKFDLYNGRADLPLTHQQWNFTLSDLGPDGEVPEWHGICHGSAQASVSEQEPGNQAVVRLPDGRPIVFYSGDVQALVAGAYSDLSRVNTKLVGSRCDDQNPATDAYGRPTDPNCRSINPGSFHLILTQWLGQLGKPLIGDMTSHAQIWNYPITGYSMQVGQVRYVDSSDPWAAPGTEFLVDVTATVNLIAGANPSRNSGNLAPDSRQVSYTLELDHYGRILGGEWTSADHPAFLWEVFSKPSDPAGTLLPWSKVKTILAASEGTGQAPAQPNPPTRPTQPTQPTQPTGVAPADGTPQAYAVVRLVNTVTSAYLIEHTGISQADAAALDRYYAGPDGVIGTADDQRFTSARQVAGLVSAGDLQNLIDFAMANGWAGPG